MGFHDSNKSGLFLSIWYFYCFCVQSTLQNPPSHVLRIREGTPTGTVIIPDLVTFLGDHAQAPSDSTGDRDSILAIGNAIMPGVSWFAIDPRRKSLVIKTPPDRDELCPTEFILPRTAVMTDRGGIEFPEYFLKSANKYQRNSDDCVLKLSIVHGSASNPSFEIISIILEDLNDHAPTFPTDQRRAGDATPFVISISENFGPVRPELGKSTEDNRDQFKPRKIALPQAKDQDHGINSIRGYRLEGQDAHYFRLEVGVSSPPEGPRSSSNGEYARKSSFEGSDTSQLWLVPVDTGLGSSALSLDREERSQYHFILVVFDGGNPQRTSRLPIKLILEDLNDRAPVFDKPFYSGRVSESDSPGKVVLEFYAHDADGNVDNGRVNFRIPGAPEIQTRDSKQRQTSGQLSSGFSESQLAAANFFTIDQVAELGPSAGNYPLGMSISANTTQFRGRLIIRQMAKDQLRKAASRAIDTARRNEQASRRQVSASESFYDKKLTRHDSTGPNLEFVIEAYDHGAPTSLKTRVPVSVSIVDVNDHAPNIFVSYLHTPSRPFLTKGLDYITSNAWGTVRENLARAMVAQVTVTDDDAVYASTELSCSSSDNRFVLEDITSAGREMNNMWIGTAPTKNEKSISSQDSSHTTPTVMYKLMLNSPLDREINKHQPARIEFSLNCVDNVHNHLPGGQLTSTVPIRVLIEDVNDNVPVFEHSLYTFHVPENHPTMLPGVNERYTQPERHYVGQVRATDADEAWHAALEYRLLSNPSSAIELNAITGQLYLIRPFDRETTEKIQFKVIAIDCRVNNETQSSKPESVTRLTGTTDIRLVIDDLNDSPPIFDEINYHFEVEEGIDLARVGQVSATDNDLGEAARISYRLAVGPTIKMDSSLTYNHGNDKGHGLRNSNHLYDEALKITTHFQINPTTGVIRLKGHLDREKQAHYEFIVLAVDNPAVSQHKSDHSQSQKDVAQFTATATVLITVLDRNDNAPQIVSPKNHAEFLLNPDQLIAGNTVFTIGANDPDLGENGTVEYQLLRIDDDLGSWMIPSTSEAANESSASSGHLTSTDQTEGVEHSLQSNPFAIDRTAGICYLRENLPPLNTDGPRAYLLRILVYDLGRPTSLNTSLTIRIVRQPHGVYDPGVLSALHTVGGDLSGSTSRSDSGHLSSGDADRLSLNSWNGANPARISDRTMVVILSTVFVLLLLTTVVLLLLIRYRRLLMRNITFNSRHGAESPSDKDATDYRLGKPSNATHFSSAANGMFPEVLSAPWVNNSSSSPIGTPQSFNYPTIYNMASAQNSNTPPHLCMKNRAACWSPMTGTLCRSPGTPCPSQSNGRRMHASPTAVSRYTETSALYPKFELLTRSQISGRHQSPITTDASSPLVGTRRALVLENYAVNLDPCEYHTLAPVDRTRSFNTPVHSTLLLPNIWAGLTGPDSQVDSREGRGRTTGEESKESGEGLSEHCGQEYNKLTQPANANTTRYQSPKFMKPNNRVRGDYQTLLRADGTLVSPDTCDTFDPLSLKASPKLFIPDNDEDTQHNFFSPHTLSNQLHSIHSGQTHVDCGHVTLSQTMQPMATFTMNKSPQHAARNVTHSIGESPRNNTAMPTSPNRNPKTDKSRIREEAKLKSTIRPRTKQSSTLGPRPTMSPKQAASSVAFDNPVTDQEETIVPTSTSPRHARTTCDGNHNLSPARRHQRETNQIATSPPNSPSHSSNNTTVNVQGSFV